MDQSQSQPLYWDRNRSSINILLIFATIVAVIGLLTEGPGLLMALGLAVAAYSWFTSARQYVIYPDSLVIIYGKPRNKIISFADISHLETLTLPIGDRLRVRLVNGQRVMLMVKDTETFRERLDRALEDFSGHPTAIEDTSSRGGNTVSDEDTVEPIDERDDTVDLTEAPAGEQDISVDLAEPAADEEQRNSPY